MTDEQARSNIAANLRRAIDTQSVNISKMVKETGVPQNTLYRMLRGENQPSVAHLATLCDYLQVSMDKIVAEPPELVEQPA